MLNSTDSSSESASCHLEWGPSRRLAAWLMALGGLAAFSLHASELPRSLLWPAVVLILVVAAWQARAELRRPWLELVVPYDGGSPTLEAAPMDDFDLSWRGPLAVLCWRDEGGRRRRAVLWPDVTEGVRRELRLAMAARVTSRSRGSVAP